MFYNTIIMLAIPNPKPSAPRSSNDLQRKLDKAQGNSRALNKEMIAWLSIALTGGALTHALSDCLEVFTLGGVT